MALGESDYGLLGVVGGLIVFITYLNSLLSGAIGRFYAIAVGEEKINSEQGIAKCQMWFTTAVVIQTIMPTVLLFCCYPMGKWAVENFLTIPSNRIHACIWVWRFVCFSCYLSMVSMPWNAMYTAHQYIAELTLYSFVTTSLNFLFLFYMVTHPSTWLVKYAFWQCLLSALPNILIAIRAHYLFRECRLVKRHLHCWNNVQKMGAFALWNAWGGFGTVLRGQGLAILVNKYFDPRANAGVAIGTSLSSHCDTLGGSLIGAFSPAIFNAWGAKEYDKARSLAFQTCKIATLLILFFSLPLSLEVNEVLRLWLKEPPQYAAGICLFVMAMTVIDKMAVGQTFCVNANGKVAKYQIFLGTTQVLTLPAAWVLIKLGLGVYSIGWAMVGTMSICALGRVWLAHSLVKMNAWYWFHKVLLPLAILIAGCISIGLLPRLLLPQSFFRVCATTTLVEFVLLPFAWLFVLNTTERNFIRSRLASMLNRLKHS